MFTGWKPREDHFMTEDFFGATEGDLITFTSTGIEVTGENTAKITGDLTMNGVTKSVVLDAKLNKVDTHPMANKPWAGFDATTTLVRSEFDLGQFAPFVSDEVQVQISVEAQKPNKRKTANTKTAGDPVTGGVYLASLTAGRGEFHSDGDGEAERIFGGLRCADAEIQPV